jgi:hypothetical protein
MQSGQIMPQSTIFSFNSRHCGFAHQMITVFNQARVDFVAIRDVQEAVPALNLLPEQPKCFEGAVAYNELDNAR